MEFIIKKFGHTVLTNIQDSRVINQLTKCRSQIENVICDVTNRRRKQGFRNEMDYTLYLTCYDQSITNKIFGHYFKVLIVLSKDIIQSIDNAKDKENQKTRRLKHNLINHNANILQELYKLIPQDSFKAGTNHIEVILTEIRKDIRKSAFTYLKVLKSSNLMKAEFDVYEMLDKDSSYLDFFEHKIHKVIILTLNPFWLDLVEKNISINIQPSQEKVNIDYKTISVALSHLFDNATKYIRPYTEFKIGFKVEHDKVAVEFDMISLKVKQEELQNIFAEEVSGYWSKQLELAGDGIGMYMINKLVKLNDGDITFKANVDPNKAFKYNDIPYEHNKITITLKNN
jgi:light-regulated signal transduction histidine kinase (bacteriophytochrome)